MVAAADALAGAIERAYGIDDHHHADYPQDLALPLQAMRSPGPYVAAVAAAGWTRIRIARLRDVEWAIAQRQPWPLGLLTHRPRYAIVADA